MSKKVSVIIPNYNNSQYIKECIESVINQNYSNIEIIIVDDGSIDDSINIIESIMKKVNFDIKFIKQVNQNAAVARNRGISESNGYYLYFLDSDDKIFSESTISHMIEKISDSELLIGNYEKIDEYNNVLDYYDNKRDYLNFEYKYKYSNLSPVPSNKLYIKDIVTKNNIYFSNVKIGQDLNFYLKYLLVVDKIQIVDENLYKYRINKNGMTDSNNMNFIDIYNSIGEVKKFYIKNNKFNDYSKYITTVAMDHYQMQVRNVCKVKKYMKRRYIFKTFNYYVYENFKDLKNNYNSYFIINLFKYNVKKIILHLRLYNFSRK